ncbi:MaoC family dehydratase [Chelativorans salis]|uniref:MaoC family dehydratase n=1 Tax=Chelativorans salis TaxID=2978478 RepID=A0ABT2LWC4_9HYPH|nr:MaoC family dehydratase [Chelativorans sp. EGI FJ00035]MCT7377494.1 MaoC family dehydratase [Chelativorans sp. EGI FJ00035]
MRRDTITIDEAEALVGEEVGVSNWRTVSQEMINQFAAATDDHQFIHTDPERAARETPYGGTIAHGFLSLSLLSTMIFEAVPQLEGTSAGVNFGFDRVRFLNPVKSGARIRARFLLAQLKVRPSGIVECHYDVTVEIENSLKPALTARWLTLAMPDRAGETAA